jgi:2'-5' RNA ligase
MNDMSPSSARVFFALWPPAGARAALAAWQLSLRKLCGGRAMRADTLHATLVFLGDVPVHSLEALKLAAQEVEGAGFVLRFDSARYWGHNHIVYAAPSVVPDALTQLVELLEQRLSAHRFCFDHRDYKPHVTLLRHAQWSDAPLPTLTPPATEWRVHEFVLVQSLRDERGARYEVLARFPLVRGLVV